jgi:hypothetical protein
VENCDGGALALGFLCANQQNTECRQPPERHNRAAAYKRRRAVARHASQIIPLVSVLFLTAVLLVYGAFQ